MCKFFGILRLHKANGQAGARVAIKGKRRLRCFMLTGRKASNGPQKEEVFACIMDVTCA